MSAGRRESSAINLDDASAGMVAPQAWTPPFGKV